MSTIGAHGGMLSAVMFAAREVVFSMRVLGCWHGTLMKLLLGALRIEEIYALRFRVLVSDSPLYFPNILVSKSSHNMCLEAHALCTPDMGSAGPGSRQIEL